MSAAQKKPLRIAFFGEAMAELSLGRDESVPPSLGFAGDTMNTAIYLKRLMGEDAEISYLSVLGQDPLSARLIGVLKNESINTDGIQLHDELVVGLYAITTDNDGERTFSYWRSNSAARTLFQSGDHLNFESLSAYDVIYFSAISLAILPNKVRTALIAALQALKKDNQVTIIFDSNYRPALWESAEVAKQLVADAWRLSDISLPSVDDEQNLFGDKDEAAVLERMHSYGVDNGALKRGENGPLSLRRSENDASYVQAQGARAWLQEPVDVVDTTAAGDSFNAGYISAILSDKTQEEALETGHACASRVIAHRGAIIPKDQW